MDKGVMRKITSKIQEDLLGQNRVNPFLAKIGFVKNRVEGGRVGKVSRLWLVSDFYDV